MKYGLLVERILHELTTFETKEEIVSNDSGNEDIESLINDLENRYSHDISPSDEIQSEVPDDDQDTEYTSSPLGKIGTITPLQVFYNRYGKERTDAAIQAIKTKYGKTGDLYLGKVLPRYFNNRLNKQIPVIASDEVSDVSHGDAEHYINGYPQKMRVSRLEPNLYKPLIDELEGRDFDLDPSNIKTNKWNLPIEFDLMGHELVHILQSNSAGDIDKVDYEMAANLHEFKNWYFRKTGKYLDANSTDEDIDEMIRYYESQPNHTPNEQTIEYLKTPEGKEFSRRIVMNKDKSKNNIA